MASHSSILPGKSHGQRNLEGYSPCGHKRVRHDLVIKQQQGILYLEHGSLLQENGSLK